MGRGDSGNRRTALILAAFALALFLVVILRYGLLK